MTPPPLKALHEVPAPAKLNLFLHVTGRRADGYHLLQSVFVLIDWCDTLHLECRSDGRLQRHDLGPALPDDDLCLRAARTLQQASGSTLGADLHVLKQVPWGAGLGGGSSDAASTLLALNRLWGLHWPRERLAALGLQLGADVPFFIGGRPAFVEGIGEHLTPLPAGALHDADGQPARFALVKPAASIPTAAIFRSPLLARNTEPVIVAGFLADAQLQQKLGAAGPGGPAGKVAEGGLIFGRNDLQPPAEAHCPEVAEVAHWLQSRYGNSRMSGSGSAVFARVWQDGISGSPPATCLPAVPDALPAGWVGRMCRSLDQHPLVDWAG